MSKLLRFPPLIGALLLSIFALQVGAQDPASPRFEAIADGTVRDHQTGLLWAAKDSRGDVDWVSAQAYCEALGAGWPSKAELLAMYRSDPSKGQVCIGSLTCHLTPLIELFGLTPWTSETRGSDQAWYVYLADGQAYPSKSSSSQGKRALCRHE